MDNVQRHLVARTAGLLSFALLLAAAIVSWTLSTVAWPGVLILLLAIVYGIAIATGGPFFENLIDTARRMTPIVRDIAQFTTTRDTTPRPPTIVTSPEPAPRVESVWPTASPGSSYRGPTVSAPPPPSDADRAADPSTAPEMLMDLAANRADLRPIIAGNPATYPALLEWLSALGDPAVNVALRRRPS